MTMILKMIDNRTSDIPEARRKMRKFILRCIAILVAGMILPCGGAADIKYIDLTNPFLRKIPMAVPVFSALPPGQVEAKLTAGLADDVSNMLEYTGYFKMLDRASFLYDPRKGGITEKKINFQNWTTVGAELLITGGAQIVSNELILELRLFDTFKASLVVGKRYRGRMADQRDMVRRFCSEVIKALTGDEGVFYSRIAFVSNGSGHKEIYVCDFDGRDVQPMTDKRSITSFPAWSRDGRYLAFTSFINGPSQIFVRDLKSGLEKPFRFKGAQIAPGWVPHRFELSATLSIAGDQEIYLLTGGGKMIKRVTNSPGIDVDATWSPDGRKLAFVSKRAGTPQIYVQEMGSNRIQRLTFEGRYNTQPCWSPKGDKIAYSSMEEGQLNIYVIDTEGDHPVRLTHNQGDNEAPSWSPDGSLIAFRSTREGVSRIYIMTSYGTDQRRLLALTGEQSHPKWSPNMLP
jgi:TolB protein